MISEALKTNTTLTNLYLDCDEMKWRSYLKWKCKDKNEVWTVSNIGAEGAKMISEALKTNTALTTLNMDGWAFVLYQ